MNDVGLGVEGRLTAFEYTQPYSLTVGGNQILEVQESKQCLGFSDAAIITGQETQTATSSDELAEMRLDSCETTREDEGDSHIKTLRSREVGTNMRQEWIVSTSDQYAFVRWSRSVEERRFEGSKLVFGQCFGDAVCWVHRLPGNDAADAAAWVVNVPLVARNHVDMQVEDRLPRCLADVDANVVAIRSMGAFDDRARLFKGSEEFGSLRVYCVEPARYVPEGNQQRVTRTDRKSVPHPIYPSPTEKDPLGFRRAEGASRRAQEDRASVAAITSRPSKPEETHAAQRQRTMRRRATLRM